MFLRRILPAFLVLSVISCHSGQKELVEGFFDKGGDKNVTSKFTLHFQKDSIVYWNTDLLVTQIADCNQLDDAAVGIGGVKTDQYMRYEKLTKFASDSALVCLTDHKNPVVRVYSFFALQRRNSPYVMSIFKKHVTDSSEMESFSGCFKLSTTVNKRMLASLKPYPHKKSISLSKRDFRKYLKLITGDDNEYVLYF